MSYLSLLTQVCSYWAPSSNDGAGGITYSAPIQILTRFQDTVDNFQDLEGEEFISDAIIYTSTELEQNGWLYLGTSSETDPMSQNGAYRIRRLMKSQTPSGDLIVYKNICG